MKGMKEESEKREEKFTFFRVKFIDICDFYKDHYYLFKFHHWAFISLLLSCSIVMPFMFYHCKSAITYGWLSSLFMYFGLTTVRSEKEDRKNTGGLAIAFIENLP